ncbi:MAG: crosslink repair DNA glycosylase YcaQ family protein [Lapillicoccus sp.]
MTTKAAHDLTRDQARRIAVHAALLADDRPDDLLDAARRLTMLPLDPTRAVAPAAELILWSRLDPDHRPGDLDDAIASQQVVEVAGAWRALDDVALHRAEMAAWPTPGPWKDWHHQLSDWLEANQACHRDVLEQLRQDGPMPAGALHDTCVRPWRSSGWNDGKNIRMLLNLLAQRGEVAVAGRQNRERLYDLADRVYPDAPVPPLPEAEAELDRRRLRAFGLARAGAVYQQGEPVGAGDAGEPVVIEGVRGRWRVDPAALDALDAPVSDRTELLAPFDLLLHDRKRMTDMLGFDYTLEMYKPQAKRSWGYYAMPVLHGDRLVGKVDATSDHESGELLLHAVHEDEPFDDGLRSAVELRITELARWLDLTVSAAPHET